MSDPEEVTDLLIRLREAGIGLAEVSVQKPTLDEVFLTLTGHIAEQDSDNNNADDHSIEDSLTTEKDVQDA